MQSLYQKESSQHFPSNTIPYIYDGLSNTLGIATHTGFVFLSKLKALVNGYDLIHPKTVFAIEHSPYINSQQRPIILNWIQESESEDIAK